MGKSYDGESFTQGTIEEVDFIEQEIACDKTCRILDVGCGTGRHSLELARRGYSVVGVDLSSSMIDQAIEKTAAEQLAVDFFVQDACSLDFAEEFDVVIVMCEGAFSLMESDEKDYAILQGASRALRPGGKLILSAGNALFALINGLDGEFDITTLRERGTLERVDDGGHQLKLDIEQRYYLPSELTWRLRQLGFRQVEFFGQFDRSHLLTAADFELVLVAQR